MRRPVELVLLLGLLTVPLPAEAQDTKSEFWPEVDIFVNLGTKVRIIFIDSLTRDRLNPQRSGDFAYFVDFALKPVFRRDLRTQDDVFRCRYLTFRAGYQYSTSLGNHGVSSENRAILEATGRFPLPGRIIFMDRNRTEFRFSNDQPFSTVYRNRFWLEHDLKIGILVCTPYVYSEFFYNFQSHIWTPTRYALGLQIPVGSRAVLEPYVLRQNSSHPGTAHLDAAGLTLNLHF
jgi:hypothetical protein